MVYSVKKIKETFCLLEIKCVYLLCRKFNGVDILEVFNEKAPKSPMINKFL